MHRKPKQLVNLPHNVEVLVLLLNKCVLLFVVPAWIQSLSPAWTSWQNWTFRTTCSQGSRRRSSGGYGKSRSGNSSQRQKEFFFHFVPVMPRNVTLFHQKLSTFECLWKVLRLIGNPWNCSCPLLKTAGDGRRAGNSRLSTKLWQIDWKPKH